MKSTRNKTRNHTLRIAALTLVVAAATSACGQRVAQTAPEEVEFVIDQTLVGPVYENRAVGAAVQPPINWMILDPSQRQAVLEALASAADDGDYSLGVLDVFFDTDSLSFLSVSQITRANRTDQIPPVSEYTEAFSETLGIEPNAGPNDDTAIANRVSFTVNDIAVTQFRHVRANRITFTLVFVAESGDLVQLDYSIPSENYQREAVKLESSIGTLALLGPGQN